MKINTKGNLMSGPTMQYVNLGQGVALQLVPIPGGTFVMGSPDAEPDGYSDEGPQHKVTLNPFLMGRYPITQAQWRAVASLPQAERELDSDPSEFKGDNRPVERVSWFDAKEFCARLSNYTGQLYTLPSESQWEYACRAGTTTPFHFGETLESSQAIFNAHETSDVGSFPPNSFGLHDMHGNVYEWCLDHWHPSYEGAPSDGSTWITGGDDHFRLVRGGSWYSGPKNCRCAYRVYLNPDNRYYIDGFRVVGVPTRTLR